MVDGALEHHLDLQDHRARDPRAARLQPRRLDVLLGRDGRVIGVRPTRQRVEPRPGLPARLTGDDQLKAAHDARLTGHEPPACSVA
jgi:hypothetical protein